MLASSCTNCCNSLILEGKMSTYPPIRQKTPKAPPKPGGFKRKK